MSDNNTKKIIKIKRPIAPQKKPEELSLLKEFMSGTNFSASDIIPDDIIDFSSSIIPDEDIHKYNIMSTKDKTSEPSIEKFLDIDDDIFKYDNSYTENSKKEEKKSNPIFDVLNEDKTEIKKEVKKDKETELKKEESILGNMDIFDTDKSLDVKIVDIEEEAEETKTTETNSFIDDDFEFDTMLNDFIKGDETETTYSNNEVKKLLDIDKSIELAEQINNISKKSEEEAMEHLSKDEKSLFMAYVNFKRAISNMAQKANLSPPKFSIEPKILYPKFKPSIGRQIANDSLVGWDLMIETNATRLESIDHNASDEDLLNFAEKTTDRELQMAIISYVEILIEIESCEISYERRKLLSRRKRIERDIYLEYKRREEKINKYIDRITKEDFPMNAEMLVKNYFKAAKQDEENAHKTLINSPATFAPIDHKKIKDRFFGIIKASPQDGIRINKKIGEFLKNLRI